MNHFVPLSELAQVSLGYKSLQNDFFYLNQATIDSFRIEACYLKPITLLAELKGSAHVQNPSSSTWLFRCSEAEADLRGTGALRYIHAMSERPAAKKKQSSRAKTIREVLEEQSGGHWYAPKARPHAAHLWLRKAFNTVYAPFIFERSRVLDQRCNYLDPVKPLCWEVLGAVLTSTLFAYGLEINGSVSMGAGALEAPTKKLRGYPVFDPRPLTSHQKSRLVDLARVVWSSEGPIDWQCENAVPGPNLRALDVLLLAYSESALAADDIYKDLRATCKARITVAQDKAKTTKKQMNDSVASVAKGIAEPITRLLNSRRFPEDFYSQAGATMPVHISRNSLHRIEIQYFFDKAEITFVAEGGETLLQGSYDIPVGEAIVRAILLGREKFEVPARREEAQACVSQFLSWLDQLQSRIEEDLRESAVGTGYEEQVRAQVYLNLRVHPLVGERTLPPVIHFS